MLNKSNMSRPFRCTKIASVNFFDIRMSKFFSTCHALTFGPVNSVKQSYPCLKPNMSLHTIRFSCLTRLSCCNDWQPKFSRMRNQTCKQFYKLSVNFSYHTNSSSGYLSMGIVCAMIWLLLLLKLGIVEIFSLR